MYTRKETNPPRMLHVVGNSGFGGIPRIILGLGDVAREEGWQVDVLTTNPLFQEAVRRRGLGLIDLDVIRRDIRPLWDVAGLVRLRNFLRRERYWLVHTHTSKGGFVGRLAAWLADVPVVVHTVHGFAFHERSPIVTRVVYSALERMASRWCDRIVTVSEFHRQWALELKICNSRQILAIPNGVAEVERSTGIEPAEVRRQLGVYEDELLILNMSRLAGDKGLDYLIEAAALLARTALRFRVVIAGEGPVRGRLEQLARNLNVADRVSFLGFRQDVGDLLAASDLIVLPSLREGLSISLLEAMAAGKPIVATSIGSNREVASQADMARLAPPANAQALCDAILQIAEDPALILRLGVNARILFQNRYTEERMLRSYRKLYVELLNLKCPAEATVAGSHSLAVGDREW